MVPRDRVHAAAAAAHPAPAEEVVQGPILNKKCEKKVPKKVHKSEREKRKRDKQNDLFDELGKMLEPDRQNNGKACILSDTTRILKDLLSQVESLRKENSALKDESHYVALERKELFDENSLIRNEILDLQNELRMRLEGNSVWTHGTRLNLAVPHPSTPVFALQHSPQTSVIATMALPQQQSAVLDPSYAAPRQELQLFPRASAPEDNEQPQVHGRSNHVTRPQARYPTTTMVTLPGHVYPALPRMEDEQCSCGTTGSGEEDGPGNA